MSQQDLSLIGFLGVGILILVIGYWALHSDSPSYRIQQGVPPPLYVPPPTPLIVNPYPPNTLPYQLNSPPVSADLEAILTYMLQRRSYVESQELYSDDVVTALKNASHWNLASASPPSWFYRSWDNLHNYQLIYSNEYNAWTIKPAL